MENTAIKYVEIKESLLSGRYISLEDIQPIINSFPGFITSTTIGSSVEDRPIYKLEFGTGSIKVMMWSQMHGNESTTTKAIFDLINYLALNELILEKFKFLIIPILNPDGAKAYTRLNANSVDLNRDAQSRSQPETNILFKAFEEFNPDYCFNLHGQRTIYGAGLLGGPATMSFLAPAQDESRSISTNRAEAMSIISAIYLDLKNELVDGIGLYDDAFNLNCTGDTFQSLGVPTILFEAGHYADDYERETTRYFVFKAMVTALRFIQNNKELNITTYNTIPINEKNWLDVIIRNVNNKELGTIDIGILFEETLSAGKIYFVPKIEKLETLNNYKGHKEVDANFNDVKIPNSGALKVGCEIDFVIIKNEKILIKP